jgi:hypothetical protein
VKRPTQATIDEAQRWVDQCVAMLGKGLTKKGDPKGHTKNVLELVAFRASGMYERPELVTKFIDDLETQRQKFDELDHLLLCELAAIALERGELPPEPLCKYIAELLRQFINWKSHQNQSPGLMFRDGQIAHMLVQLEKQGIPLFFNRVGRRPGQTYGCDIVVEAFKKAGIRMSSATVERVWSWWSRVLVRT